MTALELKPCPFCGKKAVTEILIVEGVVFCSGCRATIIRKHEVKEDTGQDNAIAAWNRRADIAAVQPAQVRVKPLVWSDRFGPNSECSYDHITADSALGLYRVEWKGWKDFDPPTVCCGGAFIGCYNTIQSAKAAAQADYEARILAALEPQPDPRDEVIKGLVEAAEPFAQVRIKNGVSQAGDIGRTDVTNLRAALAAAKAVQHG